MDKNNKNALFTEFPPVSTEQWEEVIKKDLKGADYERRLVKTTLDGIKVRPYYRDANLEGLDYITEVKPGEFPYVRGNKADNNWLIRQNIVVEDFAAANKVAVDAVKKGAESLLFTICKHDNFSKNDVEQLLNGLDATQVELNFNVEKPIVEFIDNLAAYLGSNATNAKGSIAIDPLMKLTTKGCDCVDENCTYTSFPKAIFEKVSKLLPNFDLISVRADKFKNSGSTIVQELAFGLSVANDYLAQATNQNIAVDDIASKIRFNFAAGANYFMEIAKIRAARFLWAKVVEAYKPANNQAAVMKIHSETEKYNQTVYDPYVNMLRSTTEAMSAVIGGTDSLTVLDFNTSFDKSNEFSERIARNQQILLKRESYFDKVADPAAGSYYIENLTNSIIEQTWKLFLEVEEKGGYLEALKAGFIQEQIKEVANKRRMNIANRKEILLGTNQFPNFNETVKEAIKTPEKKCACSCETADNVVEPIKEFRGAEEFEEMRLLTEAADKRPKAFMFTYGNLTMRKARAQFACNFFACAGFEVVDNNGFATVQEGIEASKQANADIVVLCSADDEYPVISKEVVEGLKDKIIVVAGYPKDSIDELKAMGIKHFVHVKVNVLESLKQFQSELGIAK